MNNRTYNQFGWSLLVAILFHLLFVPNMNPFFLSSGGDSSIFQEMGLAMLQGKIPYYDLFDHKGFLLYCIQAVGLWLHRGHIGLFILSSVNMAIFVLLWYKTARLLLDKKSSFVALIVTFVYYLVLHMKGNDTEVWSLPYISYSVYILMSYLTKDKPVLNCQCLIIGMGIGVITYLRMNNMAPILVVCMWLAYEFIQRRQYSDLQRCFLYVIAGFVLVTLLTFALFASLYGFSHIDDMVYGTFIFNIEYALAWRNEGILKMAFILAVIVPIVVFMVLYREKQIKRAMIVALGFAFSLLCMGKSYYTHYFAILIPFFLIGVVFLLDSNIYRSLKQKRALLMIVVFILATGVYAASPYLTKKIKGIVKYEKGLKEIADVLHSYPDNELDSIWNYSGDFKGADVIRAINKTQMNRVILRLQYTVTDKLHENISIEGARPLWIMVANDPQYEYNEKKDVIYINENYEKKFTTHLDFSDSSNITFYRRKQ